MYWAQPNRTPLVRKDWWPVAVLGFFGVVLNQGLFTVGLNYTTSAHSAVIIAIGPVIILILARMLGQEALTVAKVAGMALSFAGVVMLETEQGPPQHSPLLLGDLITFGGTIGFAAYTVLGKKLASAYDAVSMNTFICVAAALMLFPLTVWQMMHIHWATIGWTGWLGMLYMAASRVAVISYFQPIVVIVLAALFLGDHPSKNLMVGTLLVMVGVVLAERGQK
jgi:drug/metabolite transporter (DMT)-like permease